MKLKEGERNSEIKKRERQKRKKVKQRDRHTDTQKKGERACETSLFNRRGFVVPVPRL